MRLPIPLDVLGAGTPLFEVGGGIPLIEVGGGIPLVEVGAGVDLVTLDCPTFFLLDDIRVVIVGGCVSAAR